MKLHPILKNARTCDLAELSHVNYIKLPCTKINASEYNQLIDWCREQKELNEGIDRTPSGGIKISPKSPINKFSSRGRFTDRGNCVGAELIILIADYDYELHEMIHFGGRLQIGSYKDDTDAKHLCGRKAFEKFKDMLATRNVKIEDKYIENGKEFKEQIEKPLIKMNFGASVDTIYEDAHHYDINSSYASAMKEICPEWSDLIDYLYENRHYKRENKDILNMTIGFFQSKWFGYKLAHISKYCISKNNEKLSKKAIEMMEQGYDIIAYNTDGFWFTGPLDGLEDSKEIGKFKIDHKHCKLRFKSAGVYEYIEDDKYTPVVRGTTVLDRTVPRDQWNWGDIYKEGARPLMYEFGEDGKIKLIDLEKGEDTL